MVVANWEGVLHYLANNKGDFCLIGPFMSRVTHTQMCCYSKFKMAARSGNFTSTLHADRYSLFMLVLANFFLR